MASLVKEVILYFGWHLMGIEALCERECFICCFNFCRLNICIEFFLLLANLGPFLMVKSEVQIDKYI